MISLKLHRDKARCIEETFFPYMKALAIMKVNDTKQLRDEYLNAKILLTLITEVEIIFKRKLLGQAKQFKFNFNDAQAITFYKFLMNYPITLEDIWLINLRQHVCEVLHKQFYKPTV